MATWTIANLERSTEDGGVITAHWRVTEVDGEFSASSYGTCGFTPDPTDPSFVAFEDLTEADVLAWVHAQLAVDSIEAGLLSSIEDQKAPKSVSGLPWTAPVEAPAA